MKIVKPALAVMLALFCNSCGYCESMPVLLEKIVAVLNTAIANTTDMQSGAENTTGISDSDRYKNGTAQEQKAVNEIADLDALPGKTRFEKLENLFYAGSNVTREDLTGWHAGHAVTNSSKNLLVYSFAAFNTPEYPGKHENSNQTICAYSHVSDRKDFAVLQKHEVRSMQKLLNSFECREIIFPEARIVFNNFNVSYRKVNGNLMERWSMGDTEKSYTVYSWYFLDVTPAGTQNSN